jgi:mediator of RNA polymerase II transcription subunit 7
MFGRPLATQEVEDSLENHPGRVQLYPRGEINHRRELKKLNHSILHNYLELLNTLVTNPHEYTFHDKVADLEQLFVNLHFLLNAFRPHQARETLISILAEQLDKRQALTLATKNAFHGVSTLLHDSLHALAIASHHHHDGDQTAPADGAAATTTEQVLATTEAEKGEELELEPDVVAAKEEARLEAEMDRLLGQISDSHHPS